MLGASLGTFDERITLLERSCLELFRQGFVLLMDQSLRLLGRLCVDSALLSG